MDVRTFEAFSMKDAVKSVKRELGPDAVVLATKERPAANGRGTIYELTAAAATSVGGGSRHLGSGGGNAGGISLAPDDLEGVRLDVAALAARLTAHLDQAPTRDQMAALSAGMQELRQLVIEALRHKDGSPLANLAPPLIPIDRKLRAMGVDDTAIAELIEHLTYLPPPGEDKTRPSETADAYYSNHSMRWLLKRIKVAPLWEIVPGVASFQAVVGPSGVGKTSLLAKIAHLYGVRDRHKVCVTSLDGRRLAAEGQMRIFCKIIGLPFIPAKSAKEVADIATSHRDIELVLVDTPGLCPKTAMGHKQSLEDIVELRALGIPVDFHLCLSITEKSSQLDEAVRAFSPLGIASVAFTKLDASFSYGEIFNLSRKWSLPLSYFSVGPNVPDDIERSTRERVIERLFAM